MAHSSLVSLWQGQNKLKFIFIFLLFVSSLFASTDTRTKIKDSKNTLRSSEAMSEQLNKKLEDLANDILNGDKILKNLNKDINVLKEQIKNLESNATAENKELEELSNQNKELINTQKEIEQNIVRIIAEDFSMDLLMEGNGVSESEESIIATQILNKLNNVLKDDFKNMAKEYESTLNLIRDKSNKIDKIQTSIKTHKKKQGELLSLQEKQKATLKNLKRDKEIYTKKLDKLQTQQDEIRKTLQELAIIAKKEDDEAKRQEEIKKQAKENTKTSDDVRQIGSGYTASAVKKYRGAKTISPLDEYVVKQKFGNYVDPIYNIKIFNESIVLRSTTPDAKVKSVLNGKVVFAKQTPLLERVIIIEHDDGIHTIYAHLSQIAPTIKVGSKVQKGSVIGRVRDDLTFEVTQKNYHIDPLELIGAK